MINLDPNDENVELGELANTIKNIDTFNKLNDFVINEAFASDFMVGYRKLKVRLNNNNEIIKRSLMYACEEAVKIK
jgi:hypothetical protein